LITKVIEEFSSQCEEPIITTQPVGKRRHAYSSGAVTGYAGQPETRSSWRTESPQIPGVPKESGNAGQVSYEL